MVGCWHRRGCQNADRQHDFGQPFGKMENSRPRGLICTKTNIPCRLISISHDVQIEDYAATVHTSQKFVNDLPTSAELLYQFPVDPLSTPYACTVTIADLSTGEVRRLKAVIAERTEAQEKYDDAISSGTTAVLVERDSDGVLGLSLGNVESGHEIEVVLSYVLEMETEKSSSFPNVVEMQLTLQAMQTKSEGRNVRVVVGASVSKSHSDCSIVSLTSTSHPDSVVSQEIDPSEFRLETSENVSAEADFVVLMRVRNYPVATWLVQSLPDSRYAHLISVIPQFRDDEEEERGRREIFTEMILIVDRSGSMGWEGGKRIQKAKAALELFLQNLRDFEKIKFNIVSFGSKTQLLFPSPVEVSPEHLQEGISHVRGMEADFGGTNILQAIERVLTTPISGGYSRQVFLLTDGEDKRSSEIIAYVKRHALSTRIFSFGIGSKINPLLLDAVAKFTHGRSTFLTDDDSIEVKVLQQLERALHPSLTNVEISFPDPLVAKCCVDDITSVSMFNFERSATYFFSSGFQEEQSVRISYQRGTEASSHVLAPILMQSEVVGRLAARSRIDFLETRAEGDGDGEGCEEILRLGMAFQLVSTKTSFLLIEEKDENASPDGEGMIIQDAMAFVPPAEFRPSTSSSAAPFFLKSRVCLSVAFSIDARQSFMPKKRNSRPTLHKLAKQTLGSGDLRSAVKLPAGEDLNEWLAVNVVDFFNGMSMLWGSLAGAESCRPEACPKMLGRDYEYLWVNPPAVPRPISLSAPAYIDTMISFIATKIEDSSLFPPEGVAFPRTFKDEIKRIFKLIFRFYAHAFSFHMIDFYERGEEAHMKTSFKHFMLFVFEFELIRVREMEVLKELLRDLCGREYERALRKWERARERRRPTGGQPDQQ